MRRWLVGMVVLLIAFGTVVLVRLGPEPVPVPEPAPTLTERTPAPRAAVRVDAPRATVDASLPEPPGPLDAVVEVVDAGGVVAGADAGPSADLAPAGEAPAAPVALLTAMDAGARAARNDPRFTIRWGQAGLCGEEPLERLAQRRAALLATFIGVRRAGTMILRHPDVPPDFVDLVGDSLSQARVIVTGLLGPRADVALPLVYVYASAEQLRDVACVNTATAGYYDGAIHLPASDLDFHRTVIHEHVHHVLNALGVRKPMWLHEGLAMYAADERWWEDPRLGLTAWLRSAHLPFPALTEAFPHTADELFAGAAYYQSYQMVSFVGARSGQPDFFWLVEALSSGRFEAQTAFAQSVGLSDEQLELAWRAFLLSR